MRLVFFIIYFGCYSLIFSQNELLLPVQEITEINPALQFSYLKPNNIRSGVFNEFNFLNILIPLFYKYNFPRNNLNFQYKKSFSKNTDLNNSILSLNYGNYLAAGRKSSLGFGLKVNGINLAIDPSASVDLGLSFFNDQIVTSYTLINPLSLGSTTPIIHHFYSNLHFRITENYSKSFYIEPVIMGSIIHRNRIPNSYKIMLKTVFQEWGLISGIGNGLGERYIIAGIEYKRKYFSIIAYNQFSKGNIFQPSIKISFVPPIIPSRKFWMNSTAITTL
ncbi:MAG: hypothetical protein ACI9N1_001746 [Flavobacteriales bacterium]|jgi:hypothetical protein